MSLRLPLMTVAGCLCLLARQAAGDETPRQAYAARLAALPAEDAPAAVALADWAIEQDLRDEADDLLRRVLLAQPENEAAYQRLWRIAGERPLPLESDAATLARQLLPASFRTTQSSHFLIFSDADTTWTRAQAERLEHTHHQFEKFIKRLDLRPLPLRNRLVCILFQQREEYQTFASAQDNVTNAWMCGYYAPQHDWVVFYNATSSPAVTDAQEQLRQMQQQAQDSAKQADAARRSGEQARADLLRKQAGAQQQALQRERKRIDALTADVTTATTIHEATHLLAFHTRVQSPYVQYPLWICEGLATSFETDSPQEAFGPDREYQPRREKFTELLRAGQLMPLRELMPLMAMPSDETQTIQIVYHESYALLKWINRTRPAELRSYLMLLLKEPSGKPTPARQLEIAQTAFGDIDRLERAWLRSEREALNETPSVAGRSP